MICWSRNAVCGEFHLCTLPLVSNELSLDALGENVSSTFPRCFCTHYKFWVWGWNPLNNYSNESYRVAHSYTAVHRKGCLNFWWNLLSVIIHMKATHQYNLVQLFIMLYKVVLTYESADEIPKVLSFKWKLLTSTLFQFCFFHFTENKIWEISLTDKASLWCKSGVYFFLTVLQVWKICSKIRQSPQVHDFLHSRHLSTWQRKDIGRRK